MIIQSRRARIAASVALVFGLSLPASAQDARSTLKTLSEETQASASLEDAHRILTDLLAAAERGDDLRTEELCLATLQAAVVAGSLVSNGFPFSTVRTFEDERGPVGRLRIMSYGKRRHIEVYCAGSRLTGNVLSWRPGSRHPELYYRQSVDAAASLTLMLNAEGAADRQEVTAPLIEVPTQPPASSRSTGGQSMTEEEGKALTVNVQQCWNVGSLNSEALNTSVTVRFSIGQDRRPITDSIQMIDSSGGGESAARQAFESARRAIVRCGANGLKVPVGKYEAWKDVQLTFNPSNMQLK